MQTLSELLRSQARHFRHKTFLVFKDQSWTYGDYLAEVEKLAQVLGAPDAEKGEVPVAYIIPAAGKSPTADALIAHCRAHLAAYKAPRRVVFKDAFPLGPTGKILKKELRAMLLSELVPVTGNSDIHQEKVLHS